MEDATTDDMRGARSDGCNGQNLPDVCRIASSVLRVTWSRRCAESDRVEPTSAETGYRSSLLVLRRCQFSYRRAAGRSLLLARLLVGSFVGSYVARLCALVCLSVLPSVHPSIQLSIHPFVRPFIHPYASIHPSVLASVRARKIASPWLSFLTPVPSRRDRVSARKNVPSPSEENFRESSWPRSR